MAAHVLLIVQNNSFPSDKRVLKEARSLREAGYDVSVISPAIGRDTARSETIDGIRVWRYRHWESRGGLGGFALEYGNALLRIWGLALALFVRAPFHVMHVANPPDFFWPMGWFFKLLQVKFVFDQHDISAEMYRVNEGKDRNAIYRFLQWNERRTVRCADGIVATNASIRERLATLHGLGRRPCAVVYNGPSAEFRAVRDAGLAARYAGRRVLLYIGEMAPLDCVEVIVEVARDVVQTHAHEDCVFVLLGDGRDRPRLEAMVADLGLSAHVEFKGMVSHDEVMKHLDVAEICLVPDRANGLNEYLTLVKTLEYMKAGKPFVAFDLKETRFVGAEAACYVRDHADYVTAILELLRDPARGQAMGRAGMARVNAEFPWAKQAERLRSLYGALLPPPLQAGGDRA